jgi:pimeloyl-ACP methyl ester carboxylesterase
MLGHVKHGSGLEPVVVMHEWLGDHSNYDNVVPYLDQDRFSYMLTDLRGYGLSKKLPGQFSASEAAADVLRLMDSFGHQTFHVVGHSMSAMVAQRLAVDAPDRIRSVIAITPVPASGLKVDDDGRRRMRAVISDDSAAKEAIAARTGKRYGEPWLNHKLAIARTAATPEAMQGYLDMITGTDFVAETYGLRTPLLAIVGEHDIAAYREKNVRDIFERCYANFELVVCREAGHYPMLEAPVFLAANIERFLTANSIGNFSGPRAKDISRGAGI